MVQARNPFWFLSTLLALFLAAAGCQRPPEVRVDGSSTVQPLTEAVAERLALKDNTRVLVGVSGTGGGFEKFIAGEIDILNASREARPRELEQLEQNGIEFVRFTVAIDGLAVVVNPENDFVDCLTMDQLAQIWRREDPANQWSDLNPDWPAEDIELFGPDDASGTFDYFTDVVVDGAEHNRAGYTQSEDDNQLVTGVSGEKYGIAYFGFAYYDENQDSLKLVAIDSGDGCIRPSEETVASGEYHPLARPLFLYVRKDAFSRPEIITFVRFYLENVSELASQVGYVQVKPEVMEENQQAFREAAEAAAPPTQ